MDAYAVAAGLATTMELDEGPIRLLLKCFEEAFLFILL
jgi:hypothetical protein